MKTAIGLVVALSCLVGCSRTSDLTEDQKRGLEVIGKFANPNDLQIRLNVAQFAIVERSLAALNAGNDSVEDGLSRASEAFDAEVERRKAAGGLTEELVTWAEAEVNKSDAEIIAAWGKRSNAGDALKGP